MKPIFIAPALLLASLALAAPSAVHVFPETISPNGKLAVAWGVPGKTTEDAGPGEYGDSVQNYLVSNPGKKVITRLRGFEHYPGRNHGDISTVWAPDGSVGLVRFHAKWSPRALTLVTPSGKQNLILNMVNADTKRFLDRKGDRKYRATPQDFLAFEIRSAILTRSRLTLIIDASDTKRGEYTDSVELRYTFTNSAAGTLITKREAKQG